VLRLAKVFGDVFYPLNFSFTDIVAAITLVGITHRTRAHRPGGASHSHALIAAAGAGVFGQGKQQGYQHALAILHTAEAAALGSREAAARGSVEHREQIVAAAAAAGYGTQADGFSLGVSSAKQQQQQQDANGAAAGMPKSKSHQQLLKLLLDLDHDREEILEQQEAAEASAASSAAGSQTNGQSNKSDRKSGPGSPLVSLLKFDKQATATSLASSLRRASSDGAVPGRHSSSGSGRTSTMVAAAAPGTPTSSGSSMTAALPPAAAAGSAFGSSIWEQAVRQASAMAVAPGYGLNPGSRQGSGAAPNPKASDSPSHQGIAAVRSSSHCSPGLKHPSNCAGIPASRAQSWAGAMSHDGQYSGLETLVSGVATPANAPVSSPTGSGPGSNSQQPAIQASTMARVQAEAVSRGVQGSSGSSSRLSRQQQPEQHSPLRPSVPLLQLAAGASNSSTSSRVPSSCGRPPLPASSAQRASSAAAAAEVKAVADTVVAELQAAAAAADAAAATAGGGGAAAAASKLAAAVEAAEAAVGAAVLSDGSSVSLELLEEALHWHRYGMPS
jgi:hypothetical protein